MKKLAVVILCFVSVSSFAQLKLGVQAGYNISSFTDKGSDLQYFNLSGISTYQAGLVVEKGLDKHFFLESGLSFVQKGGRKSKTQFATSGSSTTSKFSYLEMPLNLTYKMKLSNAVKAILGAGFYGAVGVSGTEKGTDESVTGNITTVNNKVKFANNPYYSSNTTYVKPFDFGYNILGGIEWKSFQFMLTLSNGFGNIYPTSSTKFANSVFGVSVAYLVPY